MDLKSAIVIGLCIVLASVVITVISGEGRYHMVSTSGGNVFVLDTRSGRVWSKFVKPDKGHINWSEESTPWKPREPEVKERKAEPKDTNGGDAPAAPAPK